VSTQTESIWQQEMSEIFGEIFQLERKLESLLDKVLAPYNLTTKQWLVLAVIENLFQRKPSIKEVARQLNTSHQNIKAIALNLEQRGFVTLESDPSDKRVTRLATTLQSKEFWQKREIGDKAYIAALFQYLTSQETLLLQQLLRKLSDGIDELSQQISNETKEDYDG
jgi:DNA-binding MarR family transcriptional regulator